MKIMNEKKELNIVTVVQARMNSTRLPHKVILTLEDKPLLIRELERISLSSESGTVVVATSTEPADDPIFDLCIKEKINVFRGHPQDLLDRHFRVALEFKADAVVKIPSDCPLIDPRIISKVINFYKSNSGSFDYVSNLHPATYPDGNDVEVISFNALDDVWCNAEKNFEREHTTPYIWENPHLYSIGNVYWETGLDYSMKHRWTIDYEEDYLFIKEVFAELYPQNPNFSLNDILLLLERKPELKKINERYIGVNWYRNHLNELKTITSVNTRII